MKIKTHISVTEQTYNQKCNFFIKPNKNNGKLKNICILNYTEMSFPSLERLVEISDQIIKIENILFLRFDYHRKSNILIETKNKKDFLDQINKLKDNLEIESIEYDTRDL